MLGTEEERDMKAGTAVVTLVRSAESKQKATPSFDIWTEQSIIFPYKKHKFTACCKRDHSEELVETSNTQGNVMITEKCHSNTGVNKHTDGGRCCRGEIRKQSINGKIGIIDKLSTTSGSRNSKMSFVSALLTFPRILIKKPSSGDEMN
ncbi:hypothetical protein V6N11_066953 [Hibiscus sabdariffa]|uniref:Uncharacterized protein n=1 Tax=Hibiscus sabdariffa TaxID=183260 RepID=A0ABR2SQ48_9ROSI